MTFGARVISSYEEFNKEKNINGLSQAGIYNREVPSHRAENAAVGMMMMMKATYIKNDKIKDLIIVTLRKLKKKDLHIFNIINMKTLFGRPGAFFLPPNLLSKEII